MENRKFALIGYPLGHTMSPFIHERLFQLSGLSFTYEVLEIPPEQLSARSDLLADYAGLNVTIPHKRALIPLLSTLDPKAELYGAVNTVVCAKSTGYNTDAQGFLNALAAADISITGNVVLCGCGGAARMMAYETVIAGAKLTLAVRESDFEAANELKAEIALKFADSTIEICDINQIGGNIDLLINATPLGMYPKTDGIPVKEEVLRNVKAVFDAVYNPERTRLITAAEKYGAKVQGGMPMLVHQAVVAHEIWDGVAYSKEDIEALINDANVYMNAHFQSK